MLLRFVLSWLFYVCDVSADSIVLGCLLCVCFVITSIDVFVVVCVC